MSNLMVGEREEIGMRMAGGTHLLVAVQKPCWPELQFGADLDMGDDVKNPGVYPKVDEVGVRMRLRLRMRRRRHWWRGSAAVLPFCGGHRR
jgi:hypothetical protein